MGYSSAMVQVQNANPVIGTWKGNDKGEFMSFAKRLRINGFKVVDDFTYPQIPDIQINERYSLHCATPLEFLIRPDIYNVLSCHSCKMELEQERFAGNFGYLMCPYWGNFWVYKTNSEKRAKTRYTSYYGDHVNPLMSVNFLLLENNNGKLIALSPAMYGGTTDLNIDIRDIAAAIEKSTNLPVYLISGEATTFLVSITYKAQITFIDGTVAARYHDVNLPEFFKYNDDTWATETFSLYPLSSTAEKKTGCEFYGTQIGSDITFGHLSERLQDLGIDFFDRCHNCDDEVDPTEIYTFNGRQYNMCRSCNRDTKDFLNELVSPDFADEELSMFWQDEYHYVIICDNEDMYVDLLPIEDIPANAPQLSVEGILLKMVNLAQLV